MAPTEPTLSDKTQVNRGPAKPVLAKPLLDGVRVLDLTHFLAGPSCTRLMAEMGADVIKVELAPAGDPARRLPWVIDGRSVYYVQQNRGKRGICVDFKSPESCELIRRLAGEVDIVVENFGTGVLERRELDYKSLRARYPKLIMASISAFGRDGPWAEKTGFDQLAQAMGGLLALTGDADGAPALSGAPIADCASGLQAFAQIGYALWHRDRTGEGQWIDVSLVDSLFHMHAVSVQAELASDGEWAAQRNGRYSTVTAPIGSFEGNDGYQVIMAAESQWPSLCEAMGMPELMSDPRFTNATERMAHHVELGEIIEQWLRRQPTNAEAAAILDAHRVPNAPVIRPADALDHPFHQHRGSIRTIHDPLLGDVQVPGFPLHYTAHVDAGELVAPTLGQHNEEILAELLGIDEAEAADLRERGIVHALDK